MSMEIDILPIADDDEEAIRLGDLIEGVAGELSAFESAHGFSIDGVPVDVRASGRLARQARQGPERQYRRALRRATVHRAVPRKASLRCS